MENGKRHDATSSPRSSVPGLLLTVIGVVFLLENLGVIYIEDSRPYWPVLLIVIGFAKLIDVFRFPDRASN